MNAVRILLGFNHLIQKNILLIGILFALWMSMHFPLDTSGLGAFDINAPLVALIFVVQGLRMSFEGLGNVRQYGLMIGAAVLVAVVGYPLVANLLSMAFGLESDFRIGFLLLSSLPSSLEAAMAMAASAGGDPLTAVILLITLNLTGIISIPANLAIWLGGETPVNELLVLKKLLFYLFIPAFAGQMLRRFFPRLPERTEALSHYMPMVCITILVYTSCSKESALFHSLQLGDLVKIVAPCVLLHVIMIGASWLVSRKWLNLKERPARSFLFITSDKPMSLSVALWSMTYAEHHPLAIFPILVFYVGQVVFDSVVVSRQIRKDLIEQEKAALSGGANAG
ncbi:bile acid:sodium symporter [Pseudodesulfovibrio sp. zrk46]|uniref:bile acid:sodium symporter n=1 Tax=Pseudodesulfovibrio sp. zrk46 TaxID=2725288 RepID=UPI001448EC85|nr:bile acid:sodium symporter [Pseudodesulfovibrio sp. zrk46]QJB56106.1 bile acid:sodium symporter [Pseudodesulfovibrio sp. zrk46]